jgi:hypothetical protein
MMSGKISTAARTKMLRLVIKHHGQGLTLLLWH